MKKTFLLLSAVGCLVLPTVSHADSTGIGNAKKGTLNKIDVPDRIVQAHNSRTVICYITSTPRTGSMIPMVYRRYNGRIDSASNASVYGSSSIDATGALDVSTVLYKLEPSITFRR